MAFKLTPNVTVERDAQQRPRHLSHISEPYYGDEASKGSAQSLAAQYLVDVADIYEIPTDQLKSLEKSPTNEIVDTLETELRFGEEKRILETISISFAQTHFGLPIWEAGFNVVVLANPLRVTSSHSTLQYTVDIRKPNPNGPFTIDHLDVQSLAEALGLPKQSWNDLKLNKAQWRVYRYVNDERFYIDPDTEEQGTGRSGPPPTLPLLKVPKEIQEGRHYVVVESIFSYRLERWGHLNWRAFIEPDTGAVLYLRASVACTNGDVFVNDPASRSNDSTVVATAAETILNPWKQSVTIPGLTAPSAGSNQALAGEFVRVTDSDLPSAAPPSEPIGTNFNYGARTDNFSAVNAYFHCDRLFRMMQGMGFTIIGSSGYFDGTTFPVSVDHRGFGDVDNSACYGDTGNDGVGRFVFGRCVTGTTVGMCTEFQTVAHEFGHALLHDSVHSANFGFCHSAGDSLAVILADPYSVLTDRFLTFPWCPITGSGERRHNRSVGSGYAWGGTLDDHGYGSEEILSTTLFRVYQVTGGDSVHSNAAVRLATREQAARYMAYLIFRSIGSLATNPVTSTPNVGVYETALMNADTGTMSFDSFPGGTHQKIIRWSFEKQGLHQPSGAPAPVSTAGAPPPVDVYIDDGRGGEYTPYLENFWETTEIWNLTSANPTTVPSDHTTPFVGVPNFCYVRIRNRGTQTANNVNVYGYHCRPSTMLVWPSDWQPMTTAQLPAPGSPSISIPAGGIVTVGPFEWTPDVIGHECLLMMVSADGDRSNGDLTTGFPCAIGPTPHWRLVPFDNNIAQRNVVPISGGGRSPGLMAEFKNRRFGVANPTDHPIKIQIEVTLPKFLQELGWRAVFPNLKGHKLTLKAMEQRQVKLMLKRGKDFEPIDVERDQEGARIRVTTISNGIITGGITYQLDASLKKPAPEYFGKKTRKARRLIRN